MPPRWPQATGAVSRALLLHGLQVARGAAGTWQSNGGGSRPVGRPIGGRRGGGGASADERGRTKQWGSTRPLSPC
eukprot:472223-Prorocentrum_minimum.AAC.1